MFPGSFVIIESQREAGRWGPDFFDKGVPAIIARQGLLAANSVE
jgi:hypothetical protein